MTNDPHSSPTTLVDASYNLISFEPGSEPAWDAFRGLFLPQAILTLRVFPDDEAVTVMDLDAYMEKQIRDGMKEEGYTEKPLKRSELVFRDTAEVRVLFAMQFGEADPYTAIDFFQLIRLDGRWHIASISSDVLRPGEPVPDELARSG